MAEGEIRIRDRATGKTYVGSGPVPEGYDLLGPASAPAPKTETIRLQSLKDPSIVIEGPTSAPWDPREWRPASQAPPTPSPRINVPELMAGSFAAPFSQGFAQEGGFPPDAMKAAVKTGAQEMFAAALPAAGTAVGGLAGPPGMVLGGMAGEGANQLLGITEPSPEAILLNGVLPGVGHVLARAANATARFAGARLPGASSTLHEMAAEQLGKIPGAIQPKAKAEELYRLVDAFSPEIPMPNLRATTSKVLTREEQAAAGLKLGSADTAASLQQRASPVTKTVDTGVIDARGNPITRTTTTNVEGAMPFQDVRVNMRRIGDKIRELRATGGEDLGNYKQMWHAMMDDMETATASGNPAQSAVQALKNANQAMKREFAADELGDLFSIKGGGISPRPDGGGVEVNFKKIVKEIEKSDDLRRSLTKQEYDDLLKDVREMWARTPVLPKDAGVEAGSKLRGRSIAVGTGVGGAAGYYFGNTTLGGMIGAVAGGVGPDILGKLMVSPGGRRFLHGVLTGTSGVITPETMSILAVATGNTPPVRDTAVKLGELGRQYLTVGGE